MADREVRVRLSVAGTQQFQQSMQQAAQSTQGLNQAVQTQTQQSAAGMQQTSSNASKMAKAVGAAFAGLQIGKFLGDAINAASDLNETINKSNTIFGSQAAAMEAWAETATTTVGLSKAAALDAAAGFGDMFLQLGFADDAAADMSTSIVQMAADLGSFNNLGTDEVLDKISGALRGEYDSLQALIPNINGARVENEALAASGKTVAAELTAQEKATATLAIIQADSARATGDFAKTSDGLANSQKILAAEVENAKADIGEGLLPVMSTLLDLVRDVGVPILGLLGDAFGVIGSVLQPILGIISGAVGVFGSLPGPVKAAVLALAGFLALSMTGFFAGLAAAVKGLPARFAAMAASAKAAGLTMKTAFIGTGIGIAVAAIATALEVFSGNSAEAEAQSKALAASNDQSARSFADLIVEVGGVNSVLDENARKWALAALEQAAWGREGENTNLLPLADRLGLQDPGLLIDAMLGVAGAQDEVTRRVEEAAGSYLAQAAAGEISHQQAMREVEILSSLKEGYDAQLGAREEGIELAKDEASAVTTLADATAGYAQSIPDAEQAEFDDGVRLLGEAASETAGYVDALAGSTSDYGLAAEVAADRQSELADATNEVLVEMDKLAGRFPDYEQAASDMHEATANLADEFGVGTEEAEKLSGSILNADGSIRTTTDSGRRFRDGLLEVREATVTAAQAAYDKAIADGDLLGAQDKANAAAQRGYDDFMAAATAMGLSKDEAHKAAAAYNLIPDQVSTTVKTVDEATPILNNIETTMARLNGKVITTRTNHITNETIFRTTQNTTLGGPQTGRWMGGTVPGFPTGGSLEGILGLPAPSDPRADNLLGLAGGHLFKFRGDEFIMNPRASKALRPQLEAWNAAIPAYAGGGSPSGSALAGIAGRSLGQREGITAAALAELSDQLRELVGNAKDAAAELNESARSYGEARKERDQEINSARKAVVQARAKRRSEVADAMQDVRAAKSADDLREAREKLLKAQKEGNREVSKARTEMSNTIRAQRAKVAAEKAEYQSALRAQKAAQARASEIQDDMRRTAKARSVLLQLSRQMDSTTKNLESAKDRLASLTGQWQSMRESLRGNLAGTGGGITGFAEQRTTAADIIRGLTFNKNQLDVFSGNLGKAKGLGLSADLLQQIAGAGVEGGGITAKALASATRAQIAQINALNKQVVNSADRTGRLVADATYAKAIEAQTKAVSGLAAEVRSLQGLSSAIGKAVAGEFRALSNQQLAVLVAKGQKELSRR